MPMDRTCVASDILYHSFVSADLVSDTNTKFAAAIPVFGTKF